MCEGLPMSDHPDMVNVLALVKEGERYVFLFDDNSRAQMLQAIGRYAADPELNFSWYDAAVLCQKVRRLFGQVKQESADLQESEGE